MPKKHILYTSVLIGIVSASASGGQILVTEEDFQIVVNAAAAGAESCYDPAYVGTVGEAGMTGCEGMLIVDNGMLRGAGSSYAMIAGDGSFSVTGPGAVEYTFADTAQNVFTGQVTDLSYLFRNTSFNGDIGYWDTSSVITMNDIFRGNAAFNQDIGGWDTSGVRAMAFAFYQASSFNQDVSAWDVSSVVNASSMQLLFYGSAVNQDFSNWCVTNITAEPLGFASSVQVLPLPVWGTCP